MNVTVLSAADLAAWDIGEEIEQLAAGLERVQLRISLCESPVEEMFLEAWCKCDWPLMSYDVFGELMPQHEVECGGKNYRLDFAIEPLRLAIEIDGIEWHSDPERFVADLERQRALQEAGWTVYRFTGRDVWHDAESCAARAVRYATQLLLKHGQR